MLKWLCSWDILSTMRRHSSSAGLTIIELLVVIAIIGVLAAVVLTRLSDARDGAQVAAAQTELNGLHDALEVLYLDTGQYANGASSYCRTGAAIPGNNEVDLSVAASGITGDPGWSGWSGPYMQVAIDPWGTPYYLDEDYECQGTEDGCDGSTNTISALVSCGPDTDNSGAGGSCAYNADNIVRPLCGL